MQLTKDTSIETRIYLFMIEFIYLYNFYTNPFQIVVTYNNVFPTIPSKIFFGILSLSYETNLLRIPNGDYEVVLTIVNATSITKTSLIINAKTPSSDLSYLQLSMLILGNECKYFSYIKWEFQTYSASSSSVIVNVPFIPLTIFPLLR